MKNNIKTILILAFIAFVVVNCKKKESFDSPQNPTTVTDIDGNVYKVVKIGTQYWMAENLKTTRFRNGDSIPTTYPANLHTPLSPYTTYQWITGLKSKYLADYGRVYTDGAVVDTRGLAPKGWHVPSMEEYQQMLEFLGGTKGAIQGDIIGFMLKEKDTAYWNLYPPYLETNSSGFAARGGGCRNPIGLYKRLKDEAQFATKSATTQGNLLWEFSLLASNGFYYL